MGINCCVLKKCGVKLSSSVHSRHWGGWNSCCLWQWWEGTFWSAQWPLQSLFLAVSCCGLELHKPSQLISFLLFTVMSTFVFAWNSAKRALNSKCLKVARKWVHTAFNSIDEYSFTQWCSEAFSFPATSQVSFIISYIVFIARISKCFSIGMLYSVSFLLRVLIIARIWAARIDWLYQYSNAQMQCRNIIYEIKDRMW